jgi:phenylalanyl-tRNA synthetase beta subunit
MGYSEMVSIPFVSAHDNQLVPGAGKFAGLPDQPESSVRISNPIWLDRPELRSSLVSSLLPAVMSGLESGSGRFDYQRVKVFETGKVFLSRSGPKVAGQAAHFEDAQFCLLRMFSRKTGTVEARAQELISDLAALLGEIPDWERLTDYPDLLLQGGKPPFKLHLISSQKLFPREARHNFDLGLIQLRLHEYASFAAKFVPFSDAPAVVRDLNLLLPPGCEFSRLKDAVSGASANLALAVRFTLRKPDGTLTTGEAEAGLEKIKAALAKIGVTVRT